MIKTEIERIRQMITDGSLPTTHIACIGSPYAQARFPNPDVGFRLGPCLNCTVKPHLPPETLLAIETDINRLAPRTDGSRTVYHCVKLESPT